MFNHQWRKLGLGLGMGALGGWVVAQQWWVWRKLSSINVQRSLRHHANRAPCGLREIESKENDTSRMVHTIEDGIEHIVYLPKLRRFQTPILMQHGMWHGAWSWKNWQELFAEWGWESHAFSLPGHAGSVEQQPIELCTLDYYLGFLKAEVDRLLRKPVLMGHSMGGALAQWCFKYVRDDFPAAVLIAPWVSHNAVRDGLPLFLRLDPVGCLLVSLKWSASPFMRTPRSAFRALLSEGTVISSEQFHTQLGPESALVMFQHKPPYWYPPTEIRTPLLWVAGEKDAVISEAGQRRSAAHYQADYLMVQNAAHNLMMEPSYRKTAHQIHNWLVEQSLD